MGGFRDDRIDPETHKIIEIASIVTDAQLNILAEGPVIAIHQPEEELAKMDDWCTNTHTNSGLVARYKKVNTMKKRQLQKLLLFLSNGFQKAYHQFVVIVLDKIVVSYISICQH